MEQPKITLPAYIVDALPAKSPVRKALEAYEKARAKVAEAEAKVRETERARRTADYEGTPGPSEKDLQDARTASQRVTREVRDAAREVDRMTEEHRPEIARVAARASVEAHEAATAALAAFWPALDRREEAWKFAGHPGADAAYGFHWSTGPDRHGLRNRLHLTRQDTRKVAGGFPVEIVQGVADAVPVDYVTDSDVEADRKARAVESGQQVRAREARERRAVPVPRVPEHAPGHGGR